MADFHGTGVATGKTDFDLLLPQLWSEAIYGYFEKALVLRPICEDFSSLIKGKGDQINIPEIPEATGLTDKSEQTAVVYADEDIVDTNIAINKHKYIAKLFEDIAMIQSNEQMFTKYARAMGYQLAKQIDTDILVELADLGTTQDLGTDNVLALADAETAVSTLMALGIMPDDCVWIVNSLTYTDLLSQGMLTHGFGVSAAPNGINFDAPTAGGKVPTFFGSEVVMCPLLPITLTDGDQLGYYVKRGCVGLAVQQEIRVQSEYSIDNLATKVVADCIYGVEKMTANKVMGIELLAT